MNPGPSRTVVVPPDKLQSVSARLLTCSNRPGRNAHAFSKTNVSCSQSQLLWGCGNRGHARSTRQIVRLALQTV